MDEDKQRKITACQAAITGLRNKVFNYQAALIISNNIKLRVQEGDFSWEQIGTSQIELNTLLNLLEVKEKIT
ncbi:MAG: hypothetical protein NTX82_06445 [Candidatus Parcubacteria bacterium]|nr:hypothetical protein [Candidatus Parcubacteria bacterium]